jgi:hypothetical protein
MDRGPGFGSDQLGSADVVRVVVSEDYGGDRVERTVEVLEGVWKLVVVAGKPAVDDHDCTVDVAEVPPDPLGTEPVDTVRDLSDGIRATR